MVSKRLMPFILLLPKFQERENQTARDTQEQNDVDILGYSTQLAYADLENVHRIASYHIKQRRPCYLPRLEMEKSPEDADKLVFNINNSTQPFVPTRTFIPCK